MSLAISLNVFREECIDNWKLRVYWPSLQTNQLSSRFPNQWKTIWLNHSNQSLRGIIWRQNIEFNFDSRDWLLFQSNKSLVNSISNLYLSLEFIWETLSHLFHKFCGKKSHFIVFMLNSKEINDKFIEFDSELTKENRFPINPITRDDHKLYHYWSTDFPIIR